jgi:alkylhydroperoxidase family enzyme
MENGLTEDKISQLDSADNTFSPRERAALAYAEKLALDHRSIDDGFFDRLREHFDDAEILELGMMIGQYIGFGGCCRCWTWNPDSARWKIPHQDPDQP